jgi:uncharacterized protein YqgV (UPF0045/DUF77 family)
VTNAGLLSTTVEGPLDDVLAAVARAHRSADIRANRVITAVRIESRQGGLHLRDHESELRHAGGLQRP